MLRPHAASTPSIVAWLGYGGLVPFVLLAATVLAGGAYSATGRHALLTYGAVILSFVGAVNWGFAMTVPDLGELRRTRVWLWSVIPALMAWVALLLAPPAAGALLSIGFLAQYAQDRRLAHNAPLPAWYLPMRLRLTVTVCLCLAVGAGASLARASPTGPAYRLAPASEDGIGKFYEGREIAQVMGIGGASWLERPTREQEERPDLLVRELCLRAGMTVADIGAGSGYLSRRMAPLVAPGKVFAVDVQPGMVALLKQVSLQPGLGNLVPILGSSDDVKLPAGSVDLAVMVDVYHELEFPHEVMESLVRAVKPGGEVVFVEYRAEDPTVPILPLHKMSVAQLRREMRGLPFVWERTSETLPIQHVVVFRRRVTGLGVSMFLLRHGQSYFNLYFSEHRVDPGIEDPELTPLGAEQAAAAARALAETTLTRIIVSPYTRALQTAEPIQAVHGVPVHVMHEVRERAAFVCDIGSPPDRLAARFPHHDFAHLPVQWWHRGTEPERETRARANEFRAGMATRPDSRTTLLVSHWAFILALTGRSLDNGELLEYDPTDAAHRA